MSRAILIGFCLFVNAYLCLGHSDITDTPLLERTITIQIREERMEAALKKIALQGGFTFSYNPMIINSDRVITINFLNKTIREILDQLFTGSIQYKERGRYIILTRAQDGPQKERVLGGYIMDEETGERLKNVSIYDPVSLSSAITDDYGYFEIELDDPLANVTLVVNKQNYADTLLVVPPDETRLLKIPIKFNKEKIKSLADSVGQKVKRFWKKNILTIRNINVINITDTLYRKGQFSFLPFIGTNHKLSGNVINDYSVNILGGYSLGVKKFEFGGLFNSNRGNMEGFQAAGLFNAVGGDVHGVQFAGLINATAGKSDGAQFAGLINFNWDDTKSFGFAGLINYAHHDSRGVKLAGLINASLGRQNGIYAAGLINFSRRDVNGGQLSGLLNVAVDSVQGAQVAGLINTSVRYVHGAQISGLINYARRVRGVQIGLINVTDSIQGVQLGLLSFAWKGYHTFEVSADEIFYTNLAFRTGTRSFYNILTVGVKPNTLDQEETMWSFGYGIGTLPKLAKGLYLNADLTANQIVKGKIEAINLLNKLYLGVDIRVAKKLSFTVGATLNAYATDTTYDNYPELFSDYKPSIFANSLRDNIQWQWWWGGKVGVRFL